MERWQLGDGDLRRRQLRIYFASLVLSAVFSQSPVFSGQNVEEAASLAREAVMHQQAGEYAAAIEDYEVALSRGLSHPGIYANLGASYASIGDYAGAIRVYNQALILFGDSEPILLNLGLAYYKRAEFPVAMEQFNRVLAANPGNYQAAFLMADCQFRMGEYGEVISILRPFQEQMRTDAGFAYLLGTALIREGHTAEGQEYVDLILRRGASPEAHLMLASVHRMVGDVSSATEEVNRAITLNPKLPGAYTLLGQLLFSVDGMDQLSRNAALIGQVRLPEDPTAVKAAFAKELELNPNDFEANFYLGYLLGVEGRYEEASTYLGKAHDLRPDAYYATYHLASVHQYAGDLDAARTLFVELVKQVPEFPQVHSALAMIYYRQKDTASGDYHRDMVIKLKQEEQARQKAAEENGK
ncbi:MAG: tetratricopeptide repeat protein [Acidobacteriota bacterium]|nr:MAG: tetratricopeptide repeat protein [Acidobacteriota bacterium]